MICCSRLSNPRRRDAQHLMDGWMDGWVGSGNWVVSKKQILRSVDELYCAER